MNQPQPPSPASILQLLVAPTRQRRPDGCRGVARIINATLSISVALLANAMITIEANADLSDDLHKRLEQRWYITEVIVFHDANTTANSYEQLMLTDVERDTELLLDPQNSGVDALNQTTPPPELTEAEQRQAIFNAEHPNPAGSLDSVRQRDGSFADLADIEFSSIGSDIGYAINEPSNNPNDVITYNLQAFEEVLRALDRRWLNQNYLSMSDQSKRIARGRGRTILMHGAWLQAVPERSAPNPIAINNLTGSHAEQPATQSGRPAIDDAVSNDSDSLVQAPELDGELAVTVGKYLHVDVDLAYFPNGKALPVQPPAKRFGQPFDPADPPSAPAASDRSPFAQRPPANVGGRRSQPVVELSSSRAPFPTSNSPATSPVRIGLEPLEPVREDTDVAQEFMPPHLRLEQSRRMRSNQVHYIDHPGLGLLVKITQVPFPELLQEQLRLAKQSE